MKESLAASEARSEAAKVLAAHGQTCLPVDPFAIAAEKHIPIEARSLEGCSGALLRSGEDYLIVYSDALANDGFERFTVSHELGHYFLPGHPQQLFGAGQTSHYSHGGFVSDNPLEQQADAFAAALLLPEHLFRSALRAQTATGFRAIESLAALCKTSLTATAIAFARLSDDPVAVIMSSGNQVNWCFMSQCLKDRQGVRWLKKGSVIPRSSATAALNADRSRVLSGDRVESVAVLDVWIDGAPDIEVSEDVVGLGTYGKTLTVLFTDQVIGAGDEDAEPE